MSCHLVTFGAKTAFRSWSHLVVRLLGGQQMQAGYIHRIHFIFPDGSHWHSQSLKPQTNYKAETLTKRQIPSLLLSPIAHIMKQQLIIFMLVLRPQVVSLKMIGKHCIFTVSPFAVPLVLAEANRRLNK